jgi:MFS family permease
MSSPKLVTRTFALTIGAVLAYFVAVGMSADLIGRFVEDELGGNGLHIGLATASFSLVAIISRPMIARLAGRIGLGRTIVLGAAVGATGLLLSGQAHSVWMLIGLRAVNGVGEGCVFVGGLAIASRQAPDDRQAEAASVFSTAVFGGIASGPIIADAFIKGHDPHFALAFAVAALWCLVCCALATRLPALGRGERVAGHVGFIHRAALGPGAIMASGIFTVAGFTTFVATRAKDLGMGGAGPVLAMYGVLCLLIRLFGAKLPDRLGVRRAAPFALVMLAIGSATMALVDKPLGLFVGAAGMAFGASLLSPPLMAAVIATVPDSERTPALASMSAFFELGSIVGGIVLGVVAGLAEERGAFAAGALVAIGGLLATRTVLREHRDRELAALHVVPEPSAV